MSVGRRAAPPLVAGGGASRPFGSAVTSNRKVGCRFGLRRCGVGYGRPAGAVGRLALPPGGGADGQLYRDGTSFAGGIKASGGGPGGGSKPPPAAPVGNSNATIVPPLKLREYYGSGANWGKFGENGANLGQF